MDPRRKRYDVLNNAEALEELMGRHGWKIRPAAKEIGCERSSVRKALERYGLYRNAKQTKRERKITKEIRDGLLNITVRSLDVRTAEDALRVAKVDLGAWTVVKQRITYSEVTMRERQGQDSRGRWLPDVPNTYTNCHVQVTLKPKAPELLAGEELLEEIKKHSPVVPALHIPPKKLTRSLDRHLEVSLMDPHLGLTCYPPGADNPWSIEAANRMVARLLEHLLAKAEAYEPFTKIVYPFGNDFTHIDNLFGTTTAGTIQPEAAPWQHIFVQAEKLAIHIVDRLKTIAPVEVLLVMGNHDRQTAFSLGRFLWAYYHNDENVTVNATANPYVFHHHGVNLIGYEHGHSIKQTVRLAALMANERPEEWAATAGGFREWHLGDQHRKGSAKTTVMEEQGVSVEFLPGLTPPNEWHRLKSYNWQKRAGVAYVLERLRGLEARLQVNIDSRTGQIMA